MATVVPPLKCQGIKTRLLPAIRSLLLTTVQGRWIEPFCGSAVVAFNLRPERALLCDSNEHIIRFYRDLQSERITAGQVEAFLLDQGGRLQQKGAEVYYEIREGFNTKPDSLAFVFLNRACFNGVMRFNRKGQFNVPFCRKPQRFSRAYITKIINQIRTCAAILRSSQWVFETADFRQSLTSATAKDLIYADPPYAGRHVDYYSRWSARDEQDLVKSLKGLPCRFVLSTWYQNRYRTNARVQEEWGTGRFFIHLHEHFYHVGPTESLRNSMTEALIVNFAKEG